MIRCRLRCLEVADRRIKLVTAPRIAEPDDLTVVLGQRVCLYRIARPRTGLVDAVGDVEIGHLVFLGKNLFWVVQISVPPCVLYMYLQF